MVCPNCGAHNPDELAHCSQCGRGLRGVDDSQTIYLEESAVQASAATAAAAAGIATPLPSGPAPAMTWGSLPSTHVAMPSALPAGTTFGRYRIESLLGEGGMGAVYKAFDTELNRVVALKLVRPELSTNQQTMQRFKQELLLASRISHKNILRIHDLGDANGIKFITMAFVEGSDLAGLLDQHGRLPFDRALRFTRQLAAALEAAHNEGVVHRDLKPQNILIDSSDNLYVSDFGLAKSLEAEISMGTRTGQILGTPRYMAPEQVEAKEVDHRADLYSFGLIVYEMFTGDLPFRGESAMQLMYQRVTEPPKDPRTIVTNLPEWVGHLILRCLAKDPAARYQSASEILRDLDGMQAAPPRAKAPNQTISIQIPKPTRRASIAMLATFAAAIGVVGAVPKFRETVRSWLPGARTGIHHRIALLPFNIGDDKELKYVADGVQDALTAKLAGLRDVYVVNLASIPPADRQNPGKLAKDYGVTVLVRGTLQTGQNQVSVSLKADDLIKNQALLTKEFRGLRKELLTVEDSIFNELTAAMLIRESREEKKLTTAHPTEDVTAYDLYLRGANLIRGKRSLKTAQEAYDLFDRATKVDSGFALAYSGIADACIRLYDETQDEKWPQLALNAAREAQTLAQSLNDMPQVHNSLGTVYSKIGRSQEAVAELKRALELQPNSDDTLRRLGKAYQEAGQHELALDAFQRAVELNPYYWNNYNVLAGEYLKQGQKLRAQQTYQEVVKRNPAVGWGNMGAAYYEIGDLEEAIRAFEKAIPLNPAYRYQLGVVYFFQGRYQEAEKAFQAVLTGGDPDANAFAALGDTYRWSGRPKDASDAYDRAIDLALNALRTNPRDKGALEVLALCYAKQGDLRHDAAESKNALDSIRQARKIDRLDHGLMYDEAVVLTLAGQLPEALTSLENALAAGHPAHEAGADPELKALRQLPQFASALRPRPKK